MSAAAKKGPTSSVRPAARIHRRSVVRLLVRRPTPNKAEHRSDTNERCTHSLTRRSPTASTTDQLKRRSHRTSWTDGLMADSHLATRSAVGWESRRGAVRTESATVGECRATLLSVVENSIHTARLTPTWLNSWVASNSVNWMLECSDPVVRVTMPLFCFFSL